MPMMARLSLQMLAEEIQAGKGGKLADSPSDAKVWARN